MVQRPEPAVGVASTRTPAAGTLVLSSRVCAPRCISPQVDRGSGLSYIPIFRRRYHASRTVPAAAYAAWAAASAAWAACTEATSALRPSKPGAGEPGFLLEALLAGDRTRGHRPRALGRLVSSSCSASSMSLRNGWGIDLPGSFIALR